MTKAEFIEATVKSNGLQEELVNGKLCIYTDEARVYITEFEELGIESINEYTNENGFDGFDVANYLEQHTEHELWDELFNSID